MTKKLKIKVFQKGFNYSQDGPGNRLVYHLQGCNLACPWCANPESINPSGTLMVKDGKSRLSYKEFEVDELVLEAKRSKPMFFESGGITLTGGEPTLQFTAVKELLMKLKEEGIHTAIENNGTHKNLELLLPYIDYLIMDVKHYDSEKHKTVVGMSLDNLEENLKKIGELGKQAAIRIPLVHEFNGKEEDIEGFLKLFKKFPTENMTFEFLRYHEFGKDKWEECNMEYTIVDGYMKEEIVKKFEDAFIAQGLKVIRT